VDVLSKLEALVESIRTDPEAVNRMPPASRRRLAAVCMAIARRVAPPEDEAKAGVLADLRRGVRSE
jgi:hypothetical protein